MRQHRDRRRRSPLASCGRSDPGRRLDVRLIRPFSCPRGDTNFQRRDTEGSERSEEAEWARAYVNSIRTGLPSRSSAERSTSTAISSRPCCVSPLPVCQPPHPHAQLPAVVFHAVGNISRDNAMNGVVQPLASPLGTIDADPFNANRVLLLILGDCQHARSARSTRRSGGGCLATAGKQPYSCAVRGYGEDSARRTDCGGAARRPSTSRERQHQRRPGALLQPSPLH
jgi:hypothetical protein